VLVVPFPPRVPTAIVAVRTSPCFVQRVERLPLRIDADVRVPTDADPQKVSAEFEDGVLNVHLPKSPTARPRSIDVKVS
jgi:HSP20 family molecular chaperone IbpA